MAMIGRHIHPDRAGVLVVRDGRIAAIERERGRRKYWVVPGGTIENGETPAQAARREAQEELGVSITLGPLRVLIDHKEEDGSIQRHWYFEAWVASNDIEVLGPETMHGPEMGSYRAVWLDLSAIQLDAVIPRSVVHLAMLNRGSWPNSLITIDES
jgi:8-oxo-dGTP diphosphatase